MPDAELQAMETILSTLSALDDSARSRVIKWLNAKLNVTIEHIHSEKPTGSKSHTSDHDDKKDNRFSVSLASHIKEKCPTNSQVKRFLATSDWLRRRGKQLSSSAVAKALSDNQQSRLANPADCLNKNVAKGLCEKTKEGFFITPEGLEELGYK